MRRVRFLPITDDGKLRLDQLDQFLTERTTIVALAAVSNVLGTINPLAPIIERAHALDAIVVVDAAQAAPHEPLDVQLLDADFVAFSGHKMLGTLGSRNPLRAQMAGADASVSRRRKHDSPSYHGWF